MTNGERLTAAAADGDRRTQVDELTVIIKSDLAVNAATSVDELADIALALQALSDEQLDARITARQGLAPLPSASSSSAAASVADAASEDVRHGDNDDEYPVQDDDCVIPADQEAQLDAQDGWGRPAAPQPSDSQLIAENESQPWDSQTQSQSLDDDDAYSPVFLTQAPDSELQTQASLSDDDASSAAEPCEDNSATADAGATDVSDKSLTSATDARSDDAAPIAPAATSTAMSADAVVESQGFEFPAENIATTFVQCSDTESDSDAGDGASSSQQSASRGSATKRAAKRARASQEDAAVASADGTEALAASLAQSLAAAQDGGDATSTHMERDDVEEHSDSSEQQQQPSGETDVREHSGEDEDVGEVAEDPIDSADVFPQTQAPESEEGFPADDDNDDDASAKLVEPHESEDAETETQDVAALAALAPPAAAEPVTHVPDDSVDESLIDNCSASASPERLKRTRDAPAVSSDEQSAQTTPPATQSDTETDAAPTTAIETPAAADDLPRAKVPRTEATHASPRSLSPRASAPAARAIRSYFETGVPLVILQRDERSQRGPVSASARDDSHWSRVRSAREPVRRVAPVRRPTNAALRVASS